MALLEINASRIPADRPAWHAIAAVMPGPAEFFLMNLFFVDVSEALASFLTGSRIDARFNHLKTTAI
jgi:hypothetical protein